MRLYRGMAPDRNENKSLFDNKDYHKKIENRVPEEYISLLALFISWYMMESDSLEFGNKNQLAICNGKI